MCSSLIVIFMAFAINAEAPTAKDIDHFEKRIRPILVERCGNCHRTGGTTENGLALDSRETILKGGNRGAAVVPGDPDKSLIVHAIERTGDLQMPPETRLTQDEINALREWIAHGAFSLPDSTVSRNPKTIFGR